MGDALNETTPLSDRALIERVIAGEDEEYRHLVLRYQNLVYAMILRQVSDVELARELTQDSFVKAFNGLSSFRFRSEFSTWLVRIALNTTSSYFASRRYKERLKTLPLSITNLAQLQSPAPTGGEDELYMEKASKKLSISLGALKPKYRDVVVLHYLERRSYKEIATVLQIPEGTVCSRLHTALKLLRKRFRQVA